jgi:hypothetical protein
MGINPEVGRKFKPIRMSYLQDNVSQFGPWFADFLANAAISRVSTDAHYYLVTVSRIAA